MKWLPASLFGRNLLTLIVLIVLGQLIAGLIFHWRVMQPRTTQYAATVVATAVALRDALQGLPEAQRAAFVERFNHRQEDEEEQREPVRPPPPGLLLPLERLLVRHTSEALARHGMSAVWRRDSPERTYLRLQLDGRDYWLYTPILRAGIGLPRTAVLTWVLALVLALLGAYLLQRRLNRPLNALVDAVDHLGRGEQPPALAENGPREIAVLSRAFNRMATELARQEQERNIMLAGVSHDLRTPLAKMRLALEMLEGSDPALVDSAINNSRRMDAIIDQFMDFVRNGESTETVTDCDLPALLCACASGHTPAPQLELPETLVLPLRPRAFARLVDNLLSNARLYGHPPGQPAEILLRCTPLPDGVVEVAVEDRGPGIPANAVAGLLQPFARGDSARGGPPGSGLGLAIALRIARLHGSTLQLNPRPGGGLSAAIHLPAPRAMMAGLPRNHSRAS